MPYLEDVAGVRTHYLDQGHGAPVVVLHGGLESARDWQFLADALSEHHRVLRPERRGHGGTADVDGDYTYELMADETVAFIEIAVGEPSHLIGYSDGATTAMFVALDRPDLVQSLTLISGHFHHDAILGLMADRLAHPEPDNPRLASIREAYGAASPDGPEHWPTFHRKVSRLGATQPSGDVRALASIPRPTLIIAADDDVVDLHHIVDQFGSIPDARLAIIPGTSHLLHHEVPDIIAALARRFLDPDEPARLMPVRSRRQDPPPLDAS